MQKKTLNERNETTKYVKLKCVGKETILLINYLNISY
jgi:hypothetical protein